MDISTNASQDGVYYTSTSKEKNMGVVDLSPVESCRPGETSVVQGTKRNIKSRQAQMIAIGGSIGTSYFVGSGQALALGGPGFLFLSYCLMSLQVYGIVTCVVEVATYLPHVGCSMSAYASRYVSPSVGFALGWLYFYSFGIIVAYEITASAIVINYWPNNVHIAVFITVIMLAIIAINLFPVSIYAETEFWFAGIKIIMIIGLLILSLVIMLGGAPNHQRLGFHYWNDPGATKTYLLPGDAGRFTAFMSTWVFATFSFNFSPELVVFTAGEMVNPRKNLPTASRRFFARLVVFYIFGTLAIGAVCNSESEGLVSGEGNANASPWVIAIRNAGIDSLPSIINAGILTSAWSAGNSYLYMSSRALYSLAITDSAPRIFAKCNRHGVPIYAVLAASCFSLLAYLNVNTASGEVFNWFINLTNAAGFTSWIVCCIIFLRFRKACETQNRMIPYQSRIQPYAAWICLVLFTFLLLMNGFTVFYPGKFTASGFLTAYLGIPCFLALWLGHKLIAGRKQPWLFAPEDVDLTTGLDEVEADSAAWQSVEKPVEEKGSLGKRILSKITLIWK